MKRMKKWITAVVLSALTICEFNLATVSAAGPEDKVSLAGMPTFTMSDMFIYDYQLGDDGKDGFNNEYTSSMYGAEDEAYAEYYIEKQYSTLQGTLYVPKKALDNSGSRDILFDNSFAIYGDDKLLYSNEDFDLKMKPVDVEVDISDVETLRIFFSHDFYRDSRGLHAPKVVFGNPIIIKASAAEETASGSSDSSRTCSNGHSGNTGNFCRECGEKKPEAASAKFCPECGYKFEGSTPNFCPECGAAQKK